MNLKKNDKVIFIGPIAIFQSPDEVEEFHIAVEKINQIRGYIEMYHLFSERAVNQIVEILQHDAELSIMSGTFGQDDD